MIALLVLGVVVCHVILFAHSLVGSRILAPTDLLLVSGRLGVDFNDPDRYPANWILTDPIEQFVPWLSFAAGELRSGRLPLWNPYAYCGSPLLANNQSAVLSPFSWIFFAWPGPRSFVWIQLLKSLVASLGAYGYFRRIGTCAWASLVGAWAFPLSGFFMTLLFHPHSATAVWLPWGFWAAEAIVSRPKGIGGIGGAATIALLFVSGHLETAVHALVAIGFYGAWRCCEIGRSFGLGAAARPIGIAAVAAALGIAIAAVQVLPTAEYLESSLRIQLRSQGQLDAPPSAREVPYQLVRLVFPRALGSWEFDSFYIEPTASEAGDAGYVGLAIVLLAALGVAISWRQSSTWHWIMLGLIAAAPALRIPLLSAWERLPPFHVMVNYRMIVVSSWACLVLAVRGLSWLSTERRVHVPWTIAAGAIAGLCVVVFLFLAFAPPASLRNLIPPETLPWFRRHFALSAAAAAACAALVTGGIFSSTRRATHLGWGLVMLGELLSSAWRWHPQVEPESFYPRRQFIEFVRQRVGHGRVLGYPGVLSANISMMYGLRDVRGYDAVDPAPIIELLRCANPEWTPAVTHGLTSSFQSGPSPILDLLSVRYVVSLKQLDSDWPEVAYLDGVWIYENPNALERAFVPRDVQHVATTSGGLDTLRAPWFDPRELAVVREPGVAAVGASGNVTIVTDEPRRVVLDVTADAEAVVVLSDSFAPGWRVRVDGKPAQAVEANHALRAVAVSAGRHEIEWQYSPASVHIGIILSITGVAVLATWCIARLMLLRHAT
jgi:hypothetical protein